MADFAGARGRMTDAIFARLGEAATWDGVADPVRVIHKERDGEAGFGQSSQILRTNVVRVRRSEIDKPLPNQTVTLASSGRVFRLDRDATPTLDRTGVWECQVNEVV